jgi:Predicted membrane protein (DUF2078).
MADEFADERQWLRRAALLLNRESDLRRQVGLFLAGGAVLGPVVNVLEYSLTLGVLLEGVSTGLLIGLILVFLTIQNRMTSVFPEYGDDDNESEVNDSLRARYVRGEIDHERFKRRLDDKLPPGGDTDESAETLLRRQFARGEVSESEYRDRLDTLRETATGHSGVSPTDGADRTDLLQETGETD